MAVVTTGFFDGVHVGHRQVIRTLLSEARKRGEESLVLTFWPHPRAVLQNDAGSLRLLTSLDERKEILGGLGVDRVEVLPFTRDFAMMTAGEYLRRIVRDSFGGVCLVMGYDNRIGCDGLTFRELRPFADRLGIELVVVGPEGDGTAVSSTRIRNLLTTGDVAAAAGLLGREYLLRGVVVSGDRIGRTLGYPTANMQLYEPLKLIPSGGVYATAVRVLGRDFFGMTNIGIRPTVSDKKALVIETYIFDFEEDIYGLDIELRFLERIRDERRFASLEDLSRQLSRDEKECREITCIVK